MNKAIIGKKLGMSQVFMADGTLVPVTVVEAGPCQVTQIKTVENDGYEAVQIGFCDVKEKHATKAEIGHCKKAGVATKKYLREFKLEGLTLGQEIKCDMFAEGDVVDVTGTTRGRGYAGVIERWNQSRLRKSHGTGPTVREVGSMGPISTPSRVLPGKHMPGHYGCEQVTVLNLKVIKVDTARNLLLIKGAIPGAKGSLVTVKTAVKTQK